ncbi:MAG: ribosomal-protein-alanine N-acetyltransferase [Acidobacteria bacterium]|nr:MAG: ribosomal-protein-alanine N-acetyltransferase [Acidobacteriota bacterium]
MSRASLRSETTVEGRAVVAPMCEHDLLEVVEIEETTGLSQWGWDAYRAELARPEAVMLVARRGLADASGRRLIGYIAARISADELHINNIGVRPDFQHQGVGRALLGAALDIASARGARLAVLEVRAGNAAARALYERVGFKVVGERRNYYRQPVEDALVMTMRLAPEA